MQQLIQGDCLEKLKEIEDNSVDAVITDPPYGLGFMNKEWDSPAEHRRLVEREKERSKERFNEGKSPTTAPFTSCVRPGLPIKGAKEGRWFQDWCEMWAKECFRVLKPGGYLLTFSATRTYHRMTTGIEDAGFEIRDMIAWIYGSGFPKSLNIGKVIDKFLKTGNASWNGTGDSSNGALGYSKLQHQQGYRPADYSNKHQDKSEITEDKAKEWEGWGTALKPSHEDITLAQKPLDSRSDIDYTGDIISKIILCLSKSSAKTAEKNLESSQAGQNEDANTVQWRVGKSINTQEDLLEAMGMSQFFTKENTNLSIVLSWLNILAEIWLVMNTPIIKTEISLTTELKILRSLEWENILQNIMQAKNRKTSGLSADAYNAEILLNALRLKSNYIHEHFAQDTAIVSEKLKDLRPKLEPITVARKPIEGTVAENCLKWGVGGINIDECRVKGEKGSGVWGTSNKTINTDRKFNASPEMREYRSEEHSLGRFPANLILSWPENEYVLKEDITSEQKNEVCTWLQQNL